MDWKCRVRNEVVVRPNKWERKWLITLVDMLWHRVKTLLLFLILKYYTVCLGFAGRGGFNHGRRMDFFCNKLCDDWIYTMRFTIKLTRIISIHWNRDSHIGKLSMKIIDIQEKQKPQSNEADQLESKWIKKSIP